MQMALQECINVKFDHYRKGPRPRALKIQPWEHKLKKSLSVVF